MKHVLLGGLLVVVVAGAVMTGNGMRPIQAAPSPYASLFSDPGIDRGRRMACENKRCVRADVTPIQCNVMIDENCVCNNPGPNGCGNPGASCGSIELCE